MADEPNWRDIKLTKDDMDRFLRAKGAALPCSACGQAEWEIYQSEEWFTLRLPFHFIDYDKQSARGGPSPNSAMPLVVIECGNCGHYRFHARGAVARWVQANPAEEVSGE